MKSLNKSSGGKGHISQKMREARQHLLKDKPPGHFCPHCHAITFENELFCLQCTGPRPDAGWADLHESNDPWLGKILDNRYVVAALLGKGASATVYRADSLSVPRQFAIKVINTDHDPEKKRHVMARLDRELQALSHLRNPHIVSVYELMESGGDVVAVVMDLVEGMTLQQLLERQGSLSPLRACSLIRQVANGLSEAHKADMIHRDLKPENLMIEQLPAGDDFIHILDFGIVQLQGDHQERMTRGFLGTPLYASPEQVRGIDLDHRSDIYSLGAVLFSLLTGRPPFVSENVYDLLNMHVREAPPKLSNILPSVPFPAALETLIARMLAKAPEQRPTDLSVVISEIDALLNAFDRSRSFPNVPSTAEASATIDGDSEAIAEAEHRETNDDSGEPHSGIIRRPPSSATDDKTSATDDSKNLHQQASSATPYTLQVPPSQVMAGIAGHGAFATIENHSDRALLFHPGQTTPQTLRIPVPSPITSVALSQNSLIAGHENGSLSRTGLTHTKTQVVFRDPSHHAITSVTTSDNEGCIVIGNELGHAYFDQPANDTYDDWSALPDGAPVQALGLHTDSDSVAIARDGNQVEMVRIADPNIPASNLELSSAVHSLSVSPDGYLLAVAMEDDSAAIFEIPTGRQILTKPARDVDILSVDFCDDASPVAVVTVDRELRLLGVDELS